MAKAPTTDHAKARAAYVLGRITASEYAECVHELAWVSGQYFHRWKDYFRRGRRLAVIHRLPPIGTYTKRKRNG